MDERRNSGGTRRAKAPRATGIRRLAVRLLRAPALILLVLLTLPAAARAEDGHDLWLRYRPLTGAARATVQRHATELVTGSASDTLTAASDEIATAIGTMLGGPLARGSTVSRDGAILLGTPRSLPLLAELDLPLDRLGTNGYLIRSVSVNGHAATVIAGKDALGVLYGAFAWLRQVQTQAPLDRLALSDAPALQLRLLNHWDNLDGSVERGYAGGSIWDWWTLPDFKARRYTDYARANASIGINGTVLNNVNASADILSDRYLDKAAALASVFRPYGIRVYLSARFSAPIELGGLETADPLDPAVRAWWAARAAAIYRRIPDFGGFLVKANSEGQPGPQDYGRSHADGANMLAAAVKPHGGIVMWRAFVYARQTDDRVGQAYREFRPLDGRFADNVVLQVKNGPLDFQPREPFHPLFGAMPHTPLMMEVQATKEYLGFATHVAYLGPLWQEVLRFGTGALAKDSTVADVLTHPVRPGAPTGLAGVANIGTAADWTGGVFNQANWYALGRFAWNPCADAAAIAREWTAMTFTPDPAFVEPVVAAILMPSREYVVDYTGPLGLTHQMMTAHHYGPGPWIGDPDASIASSRYYSKAGRDGIGFDRTASGSNTVAQYRPEAQRLFADPHALDSRYLLWFHHVPWDFRLGDGQTVWNALVARYDQGVAGVAAMQAMWQRLRPFVDRERFEQVAAYLSIQRCEAQWWRDASIAFFQTQAGRPLPAGHAPPPHPLDWYRTQTVPHIPGQ